MNNKMMMTMIAMKIASIETAIPTMAPVLSPRGSTVGSVVMTSPVVMRGVTPVLVGLSTVMESKLVCMACLHYFLKEKDYQ